MVTTKALSIAITAAKYVSTVVYGDFNGDSCVTLVDAILLCRDIAGLELIPEAYRPDADLNASDAIDVGDVVTLCRYLAGIITELPYLGAA